MSCKLPADARESSLRGIFITKDAKVFSTSKSGCRELTVKPDKKGVPKFYCSSEKKYFSLVQVYAETFVPNEEGKPIAFIKDGGAPISEDNIVWATSDEWYESQKVNTKRLCKCCGKSVDDSMVGKLCKACFNAMAKSTSDSAEIKRFKQRIAATGFDPDTNRFSGRQRDALELYCSGESMTKIASVLGCDLKTASACIKSAVNARTLERMTTDTVTPLGYKTVADVIPAATSETKVNKNSTKKSAVAKVLTVARRVLSNVAKALKSDEYREPRIQETKSVNLFSKDFVEKLNTHVKPSIDLEDIGINAAVSRNNANRIRMAMNYREPFFQYKSTSGLFSDTFIKSLGAYATDGVSLQELLPVNRPSVMPVYKSPETPDDSFNESIKGSIEPAETEEVDEISICIPMNNSDTSLLEEQKPEMHNLVAEYSKLSIQVSFDTFCKVYWLASKYSEEHASRLTAMVIAFMFVHHTVPNTQNINKLLKLGMEVVYGW